MYFDADNDFYNEISCVYILKFRTNFYFLELFLLQVDQLHLLLQIQDLLSLKAVMLICVYKCYCAGDVM